MRCCNVSSWDHPSADATSGKKVALLFCDDADADDDDEGSGGSVNSTMIPWVPISQSFQWEAGSKEWRREMVQWRWGNSDGWMGGKRRSLVPLVMA